jgi:hypothetical protein
MRVWKILAVIGLVIAFSAAAQAENATNKLAANKLAANKLAANKLAANKLAGNKSSANGISSSHLGEGAAVDITAVELANGVRFAR